VTSLDASLPTFRLTKGTLDISDNTCTI